MPPDVAADEPGGWGAVWAPDDTLALYPLAGRGLVIDVRFALGEGVDIGWSEGPYAADAAEISAPFVVAVPGEVGERLAAVVVVITAIGPDGEAVGHSSAPRRFVPRSGAVVTWYTGDEARRPRVRHRVPVLHNRIQHGRA